MQREALCITRTVLSQQVCLSITIRYYVETAEHIVILVLLLRNSDAVTVHDGDKYRSGIKSALVLF